MVNRYIDRAGAEIGEVEARVINARDAFVFGKPARERRDLRQVEAPPERLQHRGERAHLGQHRPRLRRTFGIDVSCKAQRQPGFLERFAHRRDLMRGFVWRYAAACSHRFAQCKVRRVDPPAGEHGHAACEGHVA